MTALNNMHGNVQSTLDSSRSVANAYNTHKTYVHKYKSTEGYTYFFQDARTAHQTVRNWVGTRRIVRVRNDFTVLVGHLVTEKLLSRSYISSKVLR